MKFQAGDGCAILIGPTALNGSQRPAPYRAAERLANPRPENPRLANPSLRWRGRTVVKPRGSCAVRKTVRGADPSGLNFKSSAARRTARPQRHAATRDGRCGARVILA